MLKQNSPFLELNQNGIDLVSQYYSHKYHMPKLIKTWNVDELIDVLKSEEFSKIRHAEEGLRVPLLITGTHSTPVTYIKENEKEYLLIFDSLGNQEMAMRVAKALPEINVYTSSSETRQRDNYSCHTDAQIYLRELAGKNAEGNFLIPNLLEELKKNPSNFKGLDTIPPENLHSVKLFKSLLMTVQNPAFKQIHEQQFENMEPVHFHRDKSEDIKAFQKRYPPEALKKAEKKPSVSSYLREKGLKLADIVEIQFYINQLEIILGNLFSNEIKDNFINEAKNKLRHDSNHGFFNNQRKSERSDISELAQKLIDTILKDKDSKNELSSNSEQKVLNK